MRRSCSSTSSQFIRLPWYADCLWLIHSHPIDDLRTSAQTSTDTLFDLAARPEYIAPLRAEIEEVISRHGWTKDAMARLVKLDSFMKESSRFGGNAASRYRSLFSHRFRVLMANKPIYLVAMRRRAYQDFVFSNGVIIPQGVTVCVARRPMQLDSVRLNGQERCFQRLRPYCRTTTKILWNSRGSDSPI